MNTGPEPRQKDERTQEYLAALERRNGLPQGGNATDAWVMAMVQRKRATGASRADLNAYENALRERNGL